jgi:hypothetical protein
MSEKVVLPKFDLPGQGPHPAVKALFAVAGLLGLAMVVLGATLWHNHSRAMAAEEEKKALVAQRTAEALAAAEAAKAKVAEEQAKAAAAKAAAKVGAKPGAAQAATASAEAPAASAPAAESHHKGSSHHHASSSASHGKALAKGDGHASPTPKAQAASNKKKDDAIDKLLAQFK